MNAIKYVFTYVEKTVQIALAGTGPVPYSWAVLLVASCSYLVASSDCFEKGMQVAAFLVTSYPLLGFGSRQHTSTELAGSALQTFLLTWAQGPSGLGWGSPVTALAVVAAEVAAEDHP